MKLTDAQAMQLGRSMEKLHDDKGMHQDDKGGYAWDEIRSYIQKCRHLKEAIKS